MVMQQRKRVSAGVHDAQIRHNFLCIKFFLPCVSHRLLQRITGRKLRLRLKQI